VQKRNKVNFKTKPSQRFSAVRWLSNDRFIFPEDIFENEAFLHAKNIAHRLFHSTTKIHDYHNRIPIQIKCAFGSVYYEEIIWW